jgi:hypothetical protein
MIKDAIAENRPRPDAVARLLRALAGWRKRAARRRRRTDGLSDHLRRDVGLPR